MPHGRVFIKKAMGLVVHEAKETEIFQARELWEEMPGCHIASYRQTKERASRCCKYDTPATHLKKRNATYDLPVM